MMQNLVAYFLIVLVLVEGAAAFAEGNFYPGQNKENPVKLPFILHGGVVVGDLIIIPAAAFLWQPYLEHRWAFWAISVVVSFFITFGCHRAWWFMCEQQPGFMYPNRKFSNGDPNLWLQDLPLSALIHFLYMWIALVFIAGYIFSPMSARIVWSTFKLFVIFVPLGVIEPGIVQGWPPKKEDLTNSFVVAVALWALLGVITWVKLEHVVGL